jgi:hypothetical protein
MKVIVLGAAAGVAFGMAANPQAHAQFAAPYPPLIELPPPQPYPAPEKPASKTPHPAGVARPEDRSPPDLSRCYQGRAKIC